MRHRHSVANCAVLYAMLGLAALALAASPGTYTGTTDQARPISLTVSGDGQYVTQLSLNVKITNPAGCTATITSNPTGNFPIVADSFSYDSGATTCGSRLQVSGTFTSGTTASGTLTATNTNAGCPTVPMCPGTVTVNWTASQEATRVIGLSGDLAFGPVTVGTTATRTLTISNSGSGTLTVSGVTYPEGFSGAWSGTIAAGGSQPVTVTFAPTAEQAYGGTVTVASDKTSGTDTIESSGTGVPTPPIGLPMTITTVAGSGVYGFSGDGGQATEANMRYPREVALDSAGNMYIADADNHRIRKVAAATGIITTIAGTGTAGYNGDDVAATAAQLNYPSGLAVDGHGNVYVADRSNQRIRKVAAATGIITTIAGNGTAGSSGDDGLATEAQLQDPLGVALDGAGNLYIADFYNNRIRKVTAATGIITTVAGTGVYGFSGDGGLATAAKLRYPAGMVLDGAGNLFIADRNNHRIRKVTAATGIITTIAGTGTSGYSGDDGQATAAQLYYPARVAVSAAGDVYIADTANHRIRKVTAATGIITTVAGTGTSGYSGDGGPATDAQLDDPYGVTLDALGNLLIADTENYCIRQVIAARSGRSDFTGDLTSDILWRHTTNGDMWLWPMASGAKAGDAYVGVVADPNWEIRSQGDFDGDGTADLLWRHKLDGTLYYWRMSAGAPAAQLYVATVDIAYDIAGTGDFDGDGKADILWRSPTVGDLWLWRMNGAQVLGQDYVDTVDLGYAIKGVGDVNGDAKTDVVWQGAAGDLWAWLMNGAAKAAQAYVGTVADASYQIQQVADFDADLKADLLWWNTAAGDVWIWRMDGAAVLSEHYVGMVADTDYRIQAAGDYNGDGRADILWRNLVAGDLWVWLMNGPVKSSEAYVGVVADQGYQIVK